MKFLFLISFMVILTHCERSSTLKNNNNQNLFSFNLASQPLNLDPLFSRGLNESYLFNNLFRSLYFLKPNDKLVSEGASCHWRSQLILSCSLKKRFWSDGSKIKAQDYLRTFHRLFQANTISPNKQYLLNLKNADKILKNKRPPSDLGVRIKGDDEINFYLKKQNREFSYTLARASLAPTHKNNINLSTENYSQLVTNGPYRIKSWEKGKRFVLTNNKFYSDQTNRPDVAVYFVQNHSIAVNLYKQKKLNFLRMLPTHLYSKYKNSADFFETPVLRFDYIGFSSKLKDQLPLRKALSESINYSELQTLYNSKGRPGCSTLSRTLYGHNTDLCHKQLVKHKVSQKHLQLAFSKLGGKDHYKAMQWYQNQWQTQLNIKIDLKPIERGMLVQHISSPEADIFRKGVPLTRPTCTAALENFKSDNPNNFISKKSEKWDLMIEQMKNTSNPKLKKQLCAKGIQELLSNFEIIPVGQFYYMMLQSGDYKGWSINELNQLDLTLLSICKQKPCKPILAHML